MKEIKTSTMVKLTLLTLLIWNNRFFFYVYELIFPDFVNQHFASKTFETWLFPYLVYGIFLLGPGIVILVASILIYKGYPESKSKFKYWNWLFGIMLMNIAFYALGLAQIEPDITILIKRFLTFIVT